MSTIIVYKRTGQTNFVLDAVERQNGMTDAGKLLRIALSASGGSGNDQDADDRVRKVFDKLISDMIPLTALHQYEVRLEESRGTAPIYKIVGPTDGLKRYFLKHQSNLVAGDPNNTPIPDNQLTAAQKALNGKLKLDIGLDNFANSGNVYKMRVTVPRAAAVSASWGYLSTEIFQDEKAIEAASTAVTLAENIEGYLISSFTFSRCR